jgi:hypothetical protein
MGWTEEDVKLVHGAIGEGAIITKEDGTVQVKIDENKVDRNLFVSGFMLMVAGLQISATRSFTVRVPEDADFKMVQAAAEKHGLHLQAREDEPGLYQIVRKEN